MPSSVNSADDHRPQRHRRRVVASTTRQLVKTAAADADLRGPAAAGWPPRWTRTPATPARRPAPASNFEQVAVLGQHHGLQELHRRAHRHRGKGPHQRGRGQHPAGAGQREQQAEQDQPRVVRLPGSASAVSRSAVAVAVQRAAHRVQPGGQHRGLPAGSPRRRRSAARTGRATATAAGHRTGAMRQPVQQAGQRTAHEVLPAGCQPAQRAKQWHLASDETPGLDQATGLSHRAGVCPMRLTQGLTAVRRAGVPCG